MKWINRDDKILTQILENMTKNRLKIETFLLLHLIMSICYFLNKMDLSRPITLFSREYDNVLQNAPQNVGLKNQDFYVQKNLYFSMSMGKIHLNL